MWSWGTVARGERVGPRARMRRLPPFYSREQKFRFPDREYTAGRQGLICEELHGCCVGRVWVLGGCCVGLGVCVCVGCVMCVMCVVCCVLCVLCVCCVCVCVCVVGVCC